MSIKAWTSRYVAESVFNKALVKVNPPTNGFPLDYERNVGG